MTDPRWWEFWISRKIRAGNAKIEKVMAQLEIREPSENPTGGGFLLPQDLRWEFRSFHEENCFKRWGMRAMAAWHRLPSLRQAWCLEYRDRKDRVKRRSIGIRSSPDTKGFSSVTIFALPWREGIRWRLQKRSEWRPTKTSGRNLAKSL